MRISPKRQRRGCAPRASASGWRRRSRPHKSGPARVEARAVVHVHQMRDFMRHHRAAHEIGGHHQPPVEPDRAVCSTHEPQRRWARDKPSVGTGLPGAGADKRQIGGEQRARLAFQPALQARGQPGCAARRAGSRRSAVRACAGGRGRARSARPARESGTVPPAPGGSGRASLPSCASSQAVRLRAKSSASAVRPQRGMRDPHLAAIGGEPHGQPPRLRQPPDRHRQSLPGHFERGRLAVQPVKHSGNHLANHPPVPPPAAGSRAVPAVRPSLRGSPCRAPTCPAWWTASRSPLIR